MCIRQEARLIDADWRRAVQMDLLTYLLTYESHMLHATISWLRYLYRKRNTRCMLVQFLQLAYGIRDFHFMTLTLECHISPCYCVAKSSFKPKWLRRTYRFREIYSNMYGVRLRVRVSRIGLTLMVRVRVHGATRDYTQPEIAHDNIALLGNSILLSSIRQWTWCSGAIQNCPEGVRFLAKKIWWPFYGRHTLDAHISFKLNSSKPVSTTPTSLFISP